MPKLLNEFTPEDLADELRRLAPAATVEIEGTTVTARIPGISAYLRAKGERIYGPGLGWDLAAMAPSEWHENDPDEVVQQFVASTDSALAQVIDWLADYAWSQHVAGAAS